MKNNYLFVIDLLTVIMRQLPAKSLILVILLTQISCSSVEPLSDQPVEEETVTESEYRDFSDLEELFWSRLESSRMSFVQADVDFMTDMIAHHAQALVMSNLAPKNGANHSVQTLASRIHNAQQDEIATMQKWLRDRSQPVPMVHIDGLNLMIHMEEEPSTTNHDRMDHEAMGHHGDHSGMSHEETVESDHEMAQHSMHDHHDMPGMLTQEQLEELAATLGREFDRLFLSFMIEHHEGAVFMVNELFDADGAANDNEIYDLASDIHVEQMTEINRMRLMLEELDD